MFHSVCEESVCVQSTLAEILWRHKGQNKGWVVTMTEESCIERWIISMLRRKGQWPKKSISSGPVSQTAPAQPDPPKRLMCLLLSRWCRYEHNYYLFKYFETSAQREWRKNEARESRLHAKAQDNFHEKLSYFCPVFDSQGRSKIKGQEVFFIHNKCPLLFV